MDRHLARTHIFPIYPLFRNSFIPSHSSPARLPASLLPPFLVSCSNTRDHKVLTSPENVIYIKKRKKKRNSYVSRRHVSQMYTVTCESAMCTCIMYVSCLWMCNTRDIYKFRRRVSYVHLSIGRR